MYRSSFRLSTRPARRRTSRWWDSVGPGISTASWISPTDISRPAFTSRKNTCRRLRWASALNASTCVSSADNRATGKRAIVFIFRSIWKYRTLVKGLRRPVSPWPYDCDGQQARHEDDRRQADDREVGAGPLQAETLADPEGAEACQQDANRKLQRVLGNPR